MNIKGVSKDKALTQKIDKDGTISATDLANSEDKKANIDKLYVTVEVKNTGNRSGKQPVQIYVSAPYTGKVEKAEHVLVGFEKTDILEPGESQEVTVEINVQDFASYDVDLEHGDEANTKGGYLLEKGKYSIRAMDSSHFDQSTNLADIDDAFDQFSINLDNDAKLLADDYSLNKVSNQFTYKEKFDPEKVKVGRYKYTYNSVRTGEIMADGQSKMTIMSRKDFDATFPTAPTAADRTFNSDWYKNATIMQGFRQDDIKDKDGNVRDIVYKDSPDDPWYVDNSDIPADWTQSKDSETKATYMFADMMGIDYESDEIIKGGKFDGKTGREAWTLFMNQLTWQQIKDVVEWGGYGTVELPNVEKPADKEADGPNNLSSTFQWADEPLIASTLNKELAYKQGVIMGNICMYKGVTGWYAPGFNYHRSAFSGRNNEYYSQDAYACGTIGSYAIRGAQSRGVVTYAKHIAFNDQETNRGETFEWVDEQTMRENDLKSFQIAFQEGDQKQEWSAMVISQVLLTRITTTY